MREKQDLTTKKGRREYIKNQIYNHVKPAVKKALSEIFKNFELDTPDTPCQPEIKVGGWCLSTYPNPPRGTRLRYILSLDGDKMESLTIGGELVKSRHEEPHLYTPYTLTKDDLCPCPYCGEIPDKEDSLCHYSGNYYFNCQNHKCDWHSPERPTEALAVADVLLLKIRMDREL